MIQIIFEDETDLVKEKDAPYSKDHFFNEPHDEPTTIKLTSSFKKELIEFSKQEGFTSLGPAIRELILLGVKYYPLEASIRANENLEKHKDNPTVKRVLDYLLPF